MAKISFRTSTSLTALFAHNPREFQSHHPVPALDLAPRIDHLPSKLPPSEVLAYKGKS